MEAEWEAAQRPILVGDLPLIVVDSRCPVLVRRTCGRCLRYAAVVSCGLNIATAKRPTQALGAWIDRLAVAAKSEMSAEGVCAF